MVKQLTKQEAFDKAALGVIAQGQPSTNRVGGHCAYLGRSVSKKLHCGVGHLLADDEMRIRWDDQESQIVQLSSSDWGQKLADRRRSGISKLSRKFLEALQSAHDSAYIPGSPDSFLPVFRENMREVAKRFRISSAVLETPPPA